MEGAFGEKYDVDYTMDVRQFRNGDLEAVVKAVRPMEAALWSLPSYERRPARRKEDLSDFEKARNHARAVRRAKQNIRLLTKAIEADRLLTLTYRENQEDRQQVKCDFQRFLKLVRKEQKDWHYVAVLERQERGAYHIHCAVKGWQKIGRLRSIWYKALGGKGNESGEATPGNIDVTSPQKARWGIRRREWKSGKLAAYLTKYLAKTFDEESSEKRRYWHSKDARAPQKQRHFLRASTMIGAIVEVASLLDFVYGVAIDFSCSWMSPLEDCLWLSIGEKGAAP